MDQRLSRLLTYCERGWRLLPLYEIRADGTCACGEEHGDGRAGKHPRISNWGTTASSDPAQVGRWHETWPGANWGWALDDVFVLDSDPRNGFDLGDLDDWGNLFGFDLPGTLTQESGGGGRHLVYSQPTEGEVRNGKTWTTAGGRRATIPGLDVKGRGGYVLLEPSNHGSGGRYAWVNLETPVAAPPDGLLKMLKRGGSGSTTAANGAGEGWSGGVGEREWDPDRLARFAAGDVEPGNQYPELISFIGWARAYGHTVDQVVELAWASARNWIRGTDEHGGVRPPWTREDVERHVREYGEKLPDGRVTYALSEEQLAWALGRSGMPGEARDEKTVEAWNAKLTDRYLFRKADKVAEELIVREDLAELRGLRTKRTAGEFAETPPPPVIMEKVLAAEVNLLAGPPEAGKSLLARDWALAVASGASWRGHRVPEARHVLWVASEGLHDFADRFTTCEHWDAARNRLYVLEEPVDLVRGDDVDWLFGEYAEERPGLVVFDVIYGMGMTDDNGTKDVLPVLNSLKKISKKWGAATLALAHPGNNNRDRRVRGSSNWRALAYTEWHMADGSLTCEKSKIADKRRLSASYVAEYPGIRWLTSGEVVQEGVERTRLIDQDVAEYPDSTISARARRLAGSFGLSVERTRNITSGYLGRGE